MHKLPPIWAFCLLIVSLAGAEFRDRDFPEFLTYRTLEPAMGQLVGVIEAAVLDAMNQEH